MSTKSKIRPEWLLAATFTVLLLPNIVLSCVEPMTVAARISNILLPGGIYMLSLSLLRNPARSVWMLFVLIFLSAFQLVLLYLYGHSIIAVDMFLNLVTTNSAEVGELLGSLLPAVIGVVVIFVPILYVAARNAGKKDYVTTDALRHKLRLYGGVTTLAGLLSLTACYASGHYKATDDLYPVNVGYNIYLAFDRSARTARYDMTSRNFRFHSVATHPTDSVPETYVLVIGETARAENFGLYGYSRNTTPRLESDPGLIKFPEAYTQSNTTHKSVPMLLSAACADDYDRIYREKGIISAFREAGFSTSFISNQRPNHSFIDLFGEEADTCLFLKEQAHADANIHDCDLLDVVREILDGPRRPRLIVLHTYGSHFKYRERYPRDMALFTPDMADDVTASNRENLLNAYDNTIHYTDFFLHSLIGLLRDNGTPSAMLYTSDHGENIFDDDRGLFLHASPRPSAHELHVPLLIWLSDSYRSAYPEVTGNIEANAPRRVLTSASVFHSILDIAGIATPVLTDTLSVASDSFVRIGYSYLSDRNIPLHIEKIILPE